MASNLRRGWGLVFVVTCVPDTCFAYKLPFANEKHFDKVYNYIIDSEDWVEENTGIKITIYYVECERICEWDSFWGHYRITRQPLS